MCEFTNKQMKQEAFNFMNEKSREEVFTPQVHSYFPYALNRGRCPVCGRFLDRHDRHPKGRATRSMCNNCYDQLIATTVNTHCFVCAHPLPAHKIQKQYDNPREIANHIHDDVCMHIWTIIHNVAVTDAPEQPQTMKSLHYRQPEYISFDADRYDDQIKIRETLIDDFLNGRFEQREKMAIRRQVPRMYNGKPVKFLM